MTCSIEELAIRYEEEMKNAAGRYIGLLQDFCEEAGLSEDATEQIVDSGMVEVNGVDVLLVSGSAADPWLLQVVLDLGLVDDANAESTYKGLLTCNLLTVSSGCVFAIEPTTGHSLLVGHFSMRNEQVSGRYLMLYLDGLVASYRRSKTDSCKFSQTAKSKFYAKERTRLERQEQES